MIRMRVDGVEEARVVGGAAVLGGDDVGDGAQPHAGRRGGGGEEAEPLLGDYEGDRGGAPRGEEPAQVHHGVHVPAPRERHRHDMAAARLVPGGGGGGGAAIALAISPLLWLRACVRVVLALPSPFVCAGATLPTHACPHVHVSMDIDTIMCDGMIII